MESRRLGEPFRFPHESEQLEVRIARYKVVHIGCGRNQRVTQIRWRHPVPCRVAGSSCEEPGEAVSEVTGGIDMNSEGSTARRTTGAVFFVVLLPCLELVTLLDIC